ncbi:hypothetical protein L486_07605 [Kwoniella mangroviensis CBS 10435]|uniref:Uncharacterized protein n=1 Tax=Kwoniella mangroviensis CBS 10435 TaxID=1331196 RepID=A0A1B9IGZ1_9TREE|nr:uncharacterized protein I203_03423 [Kwoniella mangroviensis CBS 8507]OCF54949.1 hypothetical protein L486_07605 [Kwoniella mangroviensis CBS 10435]OCF67725.1 hypothetical protein I203_03423 [Kwoniella mangroviensis CBS 8507]
MLRINGSNQYINPEQVDQMVPILDQFWNSSISWTEQKGSWVELSFTGSDFWTYGVIGPSYSSIEFILDHQSLGTFSQEQEDLDYHHLLFEQHNLVDADHTLRLVNVEGEGKRMSFDYAIIQSEKMFDSTTSLSSPASTTILSSSSEAFSSPVEAIANATQGQTTIPLPSDTPALAAQITSLSASSQTDSTLPTSPEASALLAAAASSSAAAALAALSTQYSLSQLASLKEVYHFRWNPAAYFVVIFSSIVVLVFGWFIIHTYLKSWVKRNRSGTGNDLETGIDNGNGKIRSSGERDIIDKMALRIGSPMNPKKNGQPNF